MQSIIDRLNHIRAIRRRLELLMVSYITKGNGSTMKLISVFYLYKDGERIFRGLSEDDCLIWLHNIQSQSWKYALKYSGYSIKKEQEQEA